MPSPNPAATQWNERGQQLADQGHVREAWEAYSQALALDPSMSEVHHNRGLLLLGSQHFAQAIDEFTQSLHLQPNEPETIALRGEALGKLKRDHEALAEFDRALRMAPQAYRLWNMRGLYHSEREDWEQALSDWLQALQLAPERPRCWHLVGRALCELGRSDEAEPYLERSIALGENEAAVFSWRGVCRRRRGDIRAALADFHAACQMNPDSMMALAGRSSCFSELGQFREAFDDLSRMIERGGDGAKTRIDRGKLFANAGRHHEAWTDYEAALRFEPECTEIYMLRARLLDATGHRDRAEAERRTMDDLQRAQLAQLSPYSRRLPAAVLQANYQLLEAGDTDEFCFVLFSFDDAWNRQPERLQALASLLKLVKGTEPADPNMRIIAEMITDERARSSRRRPLPTNVTEGATIYYADLLIYRRFLPGGQLVPGALVPILAEPGDKGRIELAPP